MLSDPNIVNNVVLAIIAIANAITAYMAYRNHTAIGVVKNDIKTVELATNSMKDALIAGAAREGFTAGQVAGLQTASDNAAKLEAKQRDEEGGR